MIKKNKSHKFEKFFKNYIFALTNTIDKINLEKLYEASNLISKTIKKNKFIYVCGNGGSAAIANHYICDYFKGLSKYTNLKAKIKSLNSDSYLISAISNDIAYDQVFKLQAERYMNKEDILILISSSGNSKNIKEVLKFCNKKKLKTIGFSNFRGGYLAKHSNISIHSKIDNYGIGEDINHILMHLVMQFISISNLKNSTKKIII